MTDTETVKKAIETHEYCKINKQTEVEQARKEERKSLSCHGCGFNKSEVKEGEIFDFFCQSCWADHTIRIQKEERERIIGMIDALKEEYLRIVGNEEKKPEWKLLHEGLSVAVLDLIELKQNIKNDDESTDCQYCGETFHIGDTLGIANHELKCKNK